jgi:hypothetical protein
MALAVASLPASYEEPHAFRSGALEHSRPLGVRFHRVLWPIVLPFP